MQFSTRLTSLMILHKAWVFREGGMRLNINNLTKVYSKDARGMQLPNACLQRTNLSGINFTGADFNYSHFQDAVLVRTTMANCILDGADFTKANLNGADLSGAGMQWCKLDGALLRRTNLEGVNLDGVDLSKVDLSQALNVPRKYW